jgi:poly-gamma-glutamate synthesis protein (capsule biosynthesis protein)
VVVHWNYELEPHPQPAHRELARELLRVGADAVIGHHPHIVGGVESFGGKPVVYSLGNWWLPQGHFRRGRVRYPDSARLQLAFEYRVDGKHRAHWFAYEDQPERITFSSTEELAESQELARRTPFAGMSADEYLPWFRRNRHKKRALPIFRDYTAVGANRVREELVWLRHQGLMLLEATRLRAMLRL